MRLHSLQLAPWKRGHRQVIMVVPVSPGFWVKNSRRRMSQNISERGIAQQFQREPGILQITESHHLRHESKRIIEPLFGLAPPEDSRCYGAQLRAEMFRHFISLALSPRDFFTCADVHYQETTTTGAHAARRTGSMLLLRGRLTVRAWSSFGLGLERLDAIRARTGRSFQA